MKQMKEGVIVISERHSKINIKGILKDDLLTVKHTVCLCFLQFGELAEG